MVQIINYEKRERECGLEFEEGFIKELDLELDFKEQINLGEMMRNKLGMSKIVFKG